MSEENDLMQNLAGVSEVVQTAVTALAKEKEGDTVMDNVEDVVVALTEKYFDKGFDAGLEALKKAIPGDQFDGIATMILQHFQPAFKAAVLKLEDSIDGKVG
jgi:hypothetical protein